MTPPRSCRCCGPGASEIAFALPDGDAMLRCLGCGSLFPARPPPAEEAYDGYYTAAPARGGWRALARRLATIGRADYLRRATPADAMAVLDFGCGGGDFLRAIAKPGRRCFGVDPRAGGGGWTRLAEDEIEAAAPFDWITLGHVIEHLDDPALTLRRLAAALAPGGGLWLATPNAASFVLRIAGADARDVDYPRHRQIFSREGLERLLESAGLAAEFIAAPRLNAALNSWTTLKTIGFARPWTSARLIAATAVHLIAPTPATSPELVTIARRK